MIKMKYKDLPRFTRCANYRINIGLGYIESSIQDYINGDGLQLNPEFQRGHVWTKEQQIAFVEYILKGGKSDSIKLNKPDWELETECTDYRDFVCVDGLQRITALRKFMNNEFKVFNTTYASELDLPIIRRHNIVIEINDLKTEKEVLQWYVDLNSGGTIHTKEEIEKVKKMIGACDNSN